MIKLKLVDLRKLVQETVDAHAKQQKVGLLEANKSSDLDLDYSFEANMLVDKWGLDPVEIGWSKIIKSYSTGMRGNNVVVDAEKMLSEIEKIVKERTKDLDKVLTRERQ